jgi:thioredoxin reductase (NADPH)
MSQYLIDRIDATPNIEVLKNTEVVALSGSPHGQLERIRWRHRSSGNETEMALLHLFLFIGAGRALGEGAAVVVQLHTYLADTRTAPAAKKGLVGRVATAVSL